MVVASFGGGVNSTAMLIGMHERGEKVDLILFADTGGEKPHTYEFIMEFNLWLLDHGFPDIRFVQRTNREQEFKNLEQDCLDGKMLPSIAYGFKACSIKYKRDPQDKFCNNYQPCKDVWKIGLKVVKLIGYDMDEPHRARIPEDEKYAYRYPLIEWGWGREECVEAIARAGLKQPGKSACFFCPSSKKPEIMQLRRQYPALAERAVAMERNALGPKCALCGGKGWVDCGVNAAAVLAGESDNCPKCHGSGHTEAMVKGLGRSFAWGDLYAADDNQAKLFPESRIEQECGCYDG
jgi:hypothetical protein